MALVGDAVDLAFLKLSESPAGVIEGPGSCRLGGFKTREAPPAAMAWRRGTAFD